MCGIGGFLIHEPGGLPEWQADRLARELLAACDARGGDASGVVAFAADGRRHWRKASCDAYRYLECWRPLPAPVVSCLVHTRLATQGAAAFPENNHPLKRDHVYIVHNGHVTNDSELLPDGRDGEVDSEAIAAVLAAGGLDSAATGLARVKGDAAVAAVDEREPARLLLARTRTSPLHVHRNRQVTAFASTAQILARAWTRTFGGNLSALGRATAEGTVLNITPDRIVASTFQPASPAWTNWTSGWKLPEPVTRTNELDRAADDITRAIADWEECEMCGDFYIARQVHWRRTYDGEYLPMCEGCEHEAELAGLVITL